MLTATITPGSAHVFDFGTLLRGQTLIPGSIYFTVAELNKTFTTSTTSIVGNRVGNAGYDVIFWKANSGTDFSIHADISVH